MERDFFKPPGQQFKQSIVVDAVKVFANIQFQTPRLRAAELHRSLDRCFTTTANSAGKCVIDQPTIEKAKK
jgi:hypothetical protein